jgi:plastocyanin
MDLTSGLPSDLCGTNGSSPDVWFEINPTLNTTTGLLTITTCSNLTNFDTLVSVFSSSFGNPNATNITTACGTKELIACNDNNNNSCALFPTSSTLFINITSGQKYLVRLSGGNASSAGFYDIHFSLGRMVDVVAVGFAWQPSDLQVHVGDAVRWTWTGIHNIVQVDSANSTTPLLGGFGVPCCPASGEFIHVFDEAGTFFYICEPHVAEGMRGVVRVEQ